MTRFHFAALLFDLMVWFVPCAAPVPKQAAKPVELTADALVGTYHYEWGNLREGVITFSSNGEYLGIHDLTGSVIYHGKYRVDGMTVTLTEYGYNSQLDSHWGPTEYRFDFTGSTLAHLKGTSNGSTHVAIYKAKK